MGIDVSGIQNSKMTSQSKYSVPEADTKVKAPGKGTDAILVGANADMLKRVRGTAKWS